MHVTRNEVWSHFYKVVLECCGDREEIFFLFVCLTNIEVFRKELQQIFVDLPGR